MKRLLFVILNLYLLMPNFCVASNFEVQMMNRVRGTHNLKVLTHLEEITVSGARTALFIGHSDKESLSEEDKKNFPQTESFSWFTLDYNNSPGCIGQNTSNTHFNFNFNNDDARNLLNGKFDLVVVDGSTFKFFVNENDDETDPVVRLKSLLKLNVESTLMFPLEHYSPASIDSEITVGRYSYSAPGNILAKMKPGSDEYNNISDQLGKNITGHGNNFFVEVKLVYAETEPYYINGWYIKRYFVMKNPK